VRRVLYSVASSLDGFIAGPQAEIDWIPDEPAIDWDEFLGRFDTALVGRRTYEAMVRQSRDNPLSGMRTLVFSRTLHALELPGATLVNDDAARYVRALRAGEGRDIWLMGGGVLFRALLQAGLVDGVEVGLVPVLLGGGLRLLPDSSVRAQLELARAREYPSGIMLLTYDVIRDGG